MRRLLTFGCSFASQLYPTWNEILGLYFDEHRNHGKGGAGNKYIFTALMAKMADGTITADDTVVVQWSSNHRYDLYRDGRWHCKGNVMNRPDIPREFGQLWFDEVASTVDTCTLAMAACRLLDGIGCDWYMACFHDITKPMSWESNPVGHSDGYIESCSTDLAGWRHRWATTPIYQYCFDSGLDFKEWRLPDGSTMIDAHPTPTMAYGWLRDCLLPIMGIEHGNMAERVAGWQLIHDSLRSTDQLVGAYAEMEEWARNRYEFCVDGRRDGNR